MIYTHSHPRTYRLEFSYQAFNSIFLIGKRLDTAQILLSWLMALETDQQRVDISNRFIPYKQQKWSKGEL